MPLVELESGYFLLQHRFPSLRLNHQVLITECHICEVVRFQLRRCNTCPALHPLRNPPFNLFLQLRYLLALLLYRSSRHYILAPIRALQALLKDSLLLLWYPHYSVCSLIVQVRWRYVHSIHLFILNPH